MWKDFRLRRIGTIHTNYIVVPVLRPVLLDRGSVETSPPRRIGTVS